VTLDVPRVIIYTYLVTNAIVVEGEEREKVTKVLELCVDETLKIVEAYAMYRSWDLRY
jgi:hypothetical protein